MNSKIEKQKYEVERGKPHPLGARPDSKGVNFSVFSQNSTAAELLLFEGHDDITPMQVVKLDPRNNRTFYYWHCYVRELKPGAHYAYRMYGPPDADAGHRFDSGKALIDPYAFGNTDKLWDRDAACKEGDNVANSMRSVVIDIADYDWEGDKPLNHPMERSIIYEVHCGGFTKSPTSGVKHRGRFRGVIEKIPYLKKLGVTAVELLPVLDFDEKEILRITNGKALTNYWGYSTLGFFAPASQYCSTPNEGSHLNEVRELVKALHKADIEVIIDIVFNHTNEGNHEGPMISFKGLDNKVYYHLVRGKERFYMDYSGCGNTMNCNHPMVAKFIQDCLEFWVREMHVDGFRFDEGSILTRLMDGTPSAWAPVLWNIELAETLANTKLIAEAWDAAGLYQIGSFPGFRWAEWNGRFRDDIRRFVAGRPGVVGSIATRIAGSSDIYQDDGRLPINSINFVTCHDGFTLNDLVSYNQKHNEENGEDNRDGINDNLSWNCGCEGPSEDPKIEALRNRQCKNFAAILLLSQGVPMILGGDEMRRTQNGNNNAYCQDNETSWYDWTLAEKYKDVFRFFLEMISLRKRHRSLQRWNFFEGKVNERGLADVSWHGTRLMSPGWNDPGSRVLSFTLGGFDGEEDIHAILNMDDMNLDFELPPLKGRNWFEAVDTGKPSPFDIAAPGAEKLVVDENMNVQGRSVVVLVSK